MRWLSWLRERAIATPTQIPGDLWQATLLQLPFLGYLSHQDLSRLKSLTEQLLAGKSFAGAKGFQLTDEMAVPIATQAALLVLNLRLDLYDDLSAVIVTPEAFPITQQVIDDSGVVHEWEEMLAGEAIEMGGAVRLAWPDIVPAGPNDQPLVANVVIHEFAHKIDMQRGGANGYPPFLAGFHARSDFADWSTVFSVAYEDFCHRVARFEARQPGPTNAADQAHMAQNDTPRRALPMDPYAATDPAEFFAVASESFFVTPAPLAGAYPEVYRLLSRYYRQNPLSGGSTA